MAVMGRPRIEIDWAEFDKLCAIHCTLREIAGWFDCSEDTIELRVKEKYGVTFTEHYSKRNSAGKVSLRRKQYQVAMGGNTALLIWLGKQYLGQTDKNESISTEEIKISIDNQDNEL
jgi:hypothetical protein